MPPTLQGILVGLVLVGALMVTLERLWPSIRGQRLLRTGWMLDVVYWLFTPLVTRLVSRGATAVAVVSVILLLGLNVDRATVQELVKGRGPIGAQPAWLQAIEMLLLMDLVGYWLHRMFHGRRLWPFHAIHHSPVELDWLSAVRLHPVNDIVTRFVQAFVVLILGFSPLVLAGALPFLTLYAILLHANVGWSFGPFRWLIASPTFHRWHHTSADEGRDKNFAGLFPLWDILFGTYYMPGHAPTRFGVDEPVPATLWGQLLWPFRRRAAK